MFCRKCGKEIPDDSAFCPKCGATVSNEKESEVPETIQDAEIVVNDNTIFHDVEDSPSNIKPKANGEDEVVEQRNHRKTTIKILIIVAILITVALIIIIPQAGIGFEYKLLENERYAITKYTGSGGAVTIPDTIWFKPVTVISQSAFQNNGNNSKITRVKIGKNIIGIGEKAFERCTSLEELDCSAVEMNDDSNFLVMNKAFSGCTDLKKVILPNSGVVIGNEAFYNCSSLEEIKTYGHSNPDYTAVIGAAGKYNVIESEAFACCSSLKSLSLENVYIGPYAFESCRGLTELMIVGGSLGKLENNQISTYDLLLRTSTGINPYQGEGAFKNCIRLKSVEINFSDSQSVIPYDSFYGCESLESVTGTNVSAIGDLAFGNCTLLSELNFSPYPSDVSESAFKKRSIDVNLPKRWSQIYTSKALG